MKKLLLITLLSAGAISSAYSQIGARVSLITPRGDMGAVFKNALSYDVCYMLDRRKGRIRSTLGLSFTSLAPRADSFPTYQDGAGNSGNGNSIMPELRVYKPMKNYAFYIDNSFRIFSVQQFSFYAGVRLIMGLSKSSYDTYAKYNSTSVDAGANDNYYGGLGASVQGVYTVGSHAQVCAFIGHNALVATDWSYNFSHHFLGLGLNYRIKGN